MADFYSKYTAEEVEDILDAVRGQTFVPYDYVNDIMRFKNFEVVTPNCSASNAYAHADYIVDVCGDYNYSNNASFHVSVGVYNGGTIALNVNVQRLHGNANIELMVKIQSGKLVLIPLGAEWASHITFRKQSEDKATNASGTFSITELSATITRSMADSIASMIRTNGGSMTQGTVFYALSGVVARWSGGVTTASTTEVYSVSTLLNRIKALEQRVTSLEQ